jgi:hypothetical protein
MKLALNDQDPRIRWSLEGMTRVTPASSPSTPWMGKAKGEEAAEGGRPEAGWSALGSSASRGTRGRAARACERPDRYLRRTRPRIDPLAWGRLRVRVRGVLPWKRLFASLSRSRNLSPAVLLRFLAIFDSFRRDGNWAAAS